MHKSIISVWWLARAARSVTGVDQIPWKARCAFVNISIWYIPVGVSEKTRESQRDQIVKRRNIWRWWHHDSSFHQKFEDLLYPIFDSFFDLKIFQYTIFLPVIYSFENSKLILHFFMPLFIYQPAIYSLNKNPFPLWSDFI